MVRDEPQTLTKPTFCLSDSDNERRNSSQVSGLLGDLRLREHFKTRSTKAKIAVEVCSKCHPYFTGSVKFVDAAGRVDRFNKKFQGTYGKGKKAAAAPAAEKA